MGKFGMECDYLFKDNIDQFLAVVNVCFFAKVLNLHFLNFTINNYFQSIYDAFSDRHHIVYVFLAGIEYVSYSDITLTIPYGPHTASPLLLSSPI